MVKIKKELKAPVDLISSTMSPVRTADAPVNSSKQDLKQDPLEDYEGGYRFAPIEESQVSRAMISR